MIVAICEQFHDYEVDMHLLNTDDLDLSDAFHCKLKEKLEKGKKPIVHVEILGEDFDDRDDLHVPQSNIKLPCQIDRIAYVHINFDC